MGRRVLTVYELSFHEKRKRKPASFAPADLDGEDLLNIFQTWVAGLTTAETHNEGRQTWVSVDDVSLYAPRVLLLDLRIGAYGEAGELVDVDTGEPVGTIADNQAPTGSNRALLFVPETGERAYFLSEESSRGQAGGRIRELFCSYFSRYTDKVTMVMTAVTESEVWAKAAELTARRGQECRCRGRASRGGWQGVTCRSAAAREAVLEETSQGPQGREDPQAHRLSRGPAGGSQGVGNHGA